MKRTAHGFPHYPVFLNIVEKKCVVVGGGKVALRKVKVLLSHGASVTVISPTLCSEVLELAENNRINVLQRQFRPGDLHDAFIAVAATDNRDTNCLVIEEARSKAILVNVVDDAEKSDFIVPAQMRREDITIAVSTAGKSPALARKIRKKLEKEYGEEYGTLLQLISKLRDEIKQRGLDISGDEWQKALDLDTLISLLNKGNREEAEIFLRDKLDIR